MKKLSPIIYCVFVILIPSEADSLSIDSTITIFPQSKLFPSLFLDPLECQMHGSSSLLLRKNENKSMYSTVNMGFTKPVILWNGKSVSGEINFGASTFTQFDLIRRDDDSYLAGLMNNDYKVSADLSLMKYYHLLRLRVFHVSSHLGDDYMLRHNDSLSNDKSVNYEQVDLTYLRQTKNGFAYIGAGVIYTPFAFRKRVSIQTGGLQSFLKKKNIGLFAGTDIKFFAENDYIPDIRAALGISLNRKDTSVMRLWIDLYSGQLPYSTLDYGRVSLIGLGMKLNMF